MSQKLFADLQQAFSQDPVRWLSTIGVEVHGSGGGLGGVKALNCLCPRCEEGKPKGKRKFRLGVFTDKGTAHCKGACGFGATDIVDLYRQMEGIDGEHAMSKAAKSLAQKMGVTFQEWTSDSKRFFGHLPATMTDAVIDHGATFLLERKDGQPLRDYIQRHWGIEVEDAVGMGVIGWKAGTHRETKEPQVALLYPFWDESSGKLSPRYKHQTFTRQPTGEWQPGPRMWKGLKGGVEARCPDFWPRVCPGEGGEADPEGLPEAVLIVEGESDAVVAGAVLEGQCEVLALSKGKSARPSQSHFPAQLRGRHIIICQDLDAFRGPLDKIEASSQAERDKIWNHTTGPLRALVQFFQARGCTVSIAKVPLDPLTNPKGDLRDWVRAGGRELGELELFTYEDVYRDYETIHTCASLSEAMSLPIGTRVEVEATIDSIARESFVVPQESTFECRMNQPEMRGICDSCEAPIRFPDKRIQWAHHQGDLLRALESRDPEREILNRVIKKPRGCNTCSLDLAGKGAPVGGVLLVRGTDESALQAPTTPVYFHGERPRTTGRVRIIGRVRPTTKALAIMAESIDAVGLEDWRGPSEQPSPHIDFCKGHFPCRTDNLDTLQKFTDHLARCCGDHITQCYGQDVLQLAVMIGLCSSLWLRKPGSDRPVRGWIDTCIIGETSAGKSMTLQGIINRRNDWLGIYQGAGVRVTVPGLTVSHQNFRVTPGLWPTCHGRAVAMDEMHTLARKSPGALANIIDCLQTPRRDGEVHSASGSGEGVGQVFFPAAVRAFFLANPIKAGASDRRCEHWRALFGSPEAVARMDFPVWVGQPTSQGPNGVREDLLTRERLEFLIRRAWQLEPDDIVIAPEAWELAKRIFRDWQPVYELPDFGFLHRDRENTLMRVAVAVANLTFSHVESNIGQTEVREVHVLWAKQWIEQRWKDTDYDKVCADYHRSRTLRHPVKAAALLLENRPPTRVEELADLLGEVSFWQVRELAPREDIGSQGTWARDCRGFGIIKPAPTSVAGRSLFTATPGGERLIRSLLRLADEDPDLYEEHRANVEAFARGSLTSEQPPDLSDPEEWELFLREHDL